MNLYDTPKGFHFHFLGVKAFTHPLSSKAMEWVRYEESTKQPIKAAKPLAGYSSMRGISHKCTCFEKGTALTIYSDIFCGTSKLLCWSNMKFKENKMASIFRRKTKNGNEEKPLMKNIEQTDGKTLSCSFSKIFIYESKHLCIC